jgi:hypothetical protein
MLQRLLTLAVFAIIGAGIWFLDQALSGKIATVFFVSVSASLVWIFIKAGFKSTNYTPRLQLFQSCVIGAILGWSIANFYGGFA